MLLLLLLPVCHHVTHSPLNSALCADGLIAAWMYKEGVLNPFGVSLHAGLSLVLGLGFLFYGIREERVEQQ